MARRARHLVVAKFGQTYSSVYWRNYLLVYVQMHESNIHMLCRLVAPAYSSIRGSNGGKRKCTFECLPRGWPDALCKLHCRSFVNGQHLLHRSCLFCDCPCAAAAGAVPPAPTGSSKCSFARSEWARSTMADVKFDIEKLLASTNTMLSSRPPTGLAPSRATETPRGFPEPRAISFSTTKASVASTPDTAPTFSGRVPTAAAPPTFATAQQLTTSSSAAAEGAKHASQGSVTEEPINASEWLLCSAIARELQS